MLAVSSRLRIKILQCTHKPQFPWRPFPRGLTELFTRPLTPRAQLCRRGEKVAHTKKAGSTARTVTAARKGVTSDLAAAGTMIRVTRCRWLRFPSSATSSPAMHQLYTPPHVTRTHTPSGTLGPGIRLHYRATGRERACSRASARKQCQP